MVELMDTAGTDQFAAMRDLYMRNGDAFLLVYAIDSMSSFEALVPLYEQLLRVRNAAAGSVPVVLVGNKCDLEPHRQVSREQAAALASRWKVGSPMESSARKRHHVDKVFMLAVEAALKARRPPSHGPDGATRSSARRKGCKMM